MSNRVFHSIASVTMFIGMIVTLSLLVACGGGPSGPSGDPSGNGIIDSSSTGNSNNTSSSSGPTTDVRDYGNLSTAIEAIGAAQTTLVISTPQILTENTTIPPNIGLVIQNGGTITKDSLYTLALNGPFEAGLKSNIS